MVGMEMNKASETVAQSDEIRDHIFPLCVAEGGEMKGLLGTAFTIGSRGYALTAAHCIPRDATGLTGLFTVGEPSEWHGISVGQVERHPTEDVALLQLGGSGWRSIFTLSPAWHGSTLQYRMFGYPEDTYHEIVEAGQAKTRPDLVYVEGYVRRRVTTVELPSIRGTSFLS
jgi:uncharacterized protein CbrC (UPF0167 family)